MDSAEMTGLRQRLVALGEGVPEDGEATLRLLAHVFAAASRLLETSASLRSSVPVPRASSNVGDALARLDGTSPRVLYGELLGLMAHLDAEVGPRLEGLAGGVIEADLGHTRVSVRWWPSVDGPTRLGRLYDRRYKATRYDYGPERELRHVALWTPSSRLTMEALPRFDRRRRSWPLVGVPGNALRVVLSPMPGEARPRFRAQGSPPALGPDEPEMAGVPALLELLDRLLDDSRAHRAHLLVLPELMVPAVAREHLRKALRGGEFPFAVVAGSTYVAEGGALRNESVWIDRSGTPFGAHQKRGYFAMRVKDLRRTCADLPAGLPEDHRLSEDIVPGEVLRVLETTTGRMGVLICADLLDLREPTFRQLAMGSARLDLLLVISLSPTTGDFRAAAELLHRVGTSTLFVNAAHVVAPGEDRAFASSPFRMGGPDRWTEAECSPAFTRLDDNRGVVVDLARWWD